MAESKTVEMEGKGERVTIDYDKGRDRTTISKGGETVYDAGGDRVKERVDEYKRDGYTQTNGG